MDHNIEVFAGGIIRTGRIAAAYHHIAGNFTSGRFGFTAAVYEIRCSCKNTVELGYSLLVDDTGDHVPTRCAIPIPELQENKGPIHEFRL